LNIFKISFLGALCLFITLLNIGKIQAQSSAIPSELNPIVQLVEENRYFLAHEKLKELGKDFHNNFYFQFYSGITTLFLNIERPKSLAYFKKAIYIASGLKKFPQANLIMAKFYLAKTYFLLNQIDSAYYLLNRLYAITPAYKSELRKEISDLINYCNVAKSQMGRAQRVSVNPVFGLNSVFNDHSPLFTGNEEIFVFTSTRGGSTGGRISENGEFFEDIYFSTKRENSYRSPARLSQDLNTDKHDAAVWISLDGRELFVYNDISGNGDIYTSEMLADGNWKNPEPLNVINTDARETSAFKSDDGNFIFFTSDRKGGFGGLDIYMIEKLPNGLWSEALNLGATVNTAKDEETPFFHPNQKLYFSSKGHSNMGGYDIFVSDRTGRNAWAIPANLGFPINSTDDDLCFWLSTDGLRAYLSSGRFGGRGRRDIYFAEFQESYRTGFTLVSGVAKVESGYLDFLRIILDNKLSMSEYRVNISNGHFIFPVRNNYTYDATFRASGNQSQRIDFMVPENKSNNELHIYSLDTVFLHSPIIPVDSIIEKQLVLKSIYFENIDFFEAEDDFLPNSQKVETKINLDFDVEFSDVTQDIISQSFEPIFVQQKKENLPAFFIASDFTFPSNSTNFYANNGLSDLIMFLNKNKSAVIRVTGYTDGIGSEDFNKELALNRALSVEHFLLQKGVAANQIIVNRNSENTLLFDENISDNKLLNSARASNRRVEIHLEKPSKDAFLVVQPISVDSALLNHYNSPHKLFSDTLILPEFLYSVELISTPAEIDLPEKFGPFKIEIKRSNSGVYSYFIGYFEINTDALYWLREIRKRGFSSARIILESTKDIHINYYYSIHLLSCEKQVDKQLFSNLERVIEKKEKEYFVYYYGQFISLSEAERARLKVWESGFKDAFIIINNLNNAKQ
jgi:outer membrane protein OmpA-like peptidoglycan-associated protein